jgi:site-specific DNA recombinase
MPTMWGSANSGRAAQYLRYSTDRFGRARSNDEQQVDNERDAQAEGFSMVRTYRDPERSASRFATRAREEYEHVIRDMGRGEFDVLYLWESSRGSRQVGEWVALIELAAAKHVLFRITSHRRTYDPTNPRDRRSLLEDAVDAEYESGKVSERVTRSSLSSAEAGRPWGKIPFGYRRDYDPHTGALLGQFPDAVAAPIVVEIVNRVLGGEAITRIADDLTVRGVLTPSQYRAARSGLAVPDGHWTRSTIHTMLRTPTMVGMRLHRGLVVGSADWEPIVSVTAFEAARNAVRSRTTGSNPGSPVRHLLSGIATCGVCGARCDRQVNNGVPSYACAGLPAQPGRPRPSRKHVCRAQGPVDAMVVRAILARMSAPDARAVLATEQRDAAAGAAARELGELQATLAVLEEGMSSAPSPRAASIFQRQVNQLAVQIAELEVRAMPQHLPAAVHELVGPDAGERWGAMGLGRQRQVVRALLRVVIHRSSLPRGAKRFDSSSIQLVWR